MAITLNDDLRREAIASIQDFSEEQLDERLGELPAGFLLDYFLEEIGPLVYNKAVADAQERMQARVTELDIEIHEEEFQYSARKGRARRGR